MNAQPLITGTLLLLGVGFLVANARLASDYLRYLRRRRAALLIWLAPTPPFQGMTIAIAVALGLIVFYKIFFSGQQAFGETMMFVYYAYLAPLGRRIGRGFYADGIWADTSFIPYNQVGGISWREGQHSVSLIVISRLRKMARRLTVPPGHYAAARRILRDKIGEHEIHFSGVGLDLGARDERDSA